MFKSCFLFMLLCLAMLMTGRAQTSGQLASSMSGKYSAFQDKPAWQWLNLLTSATFYRVVKEGEVDFNSCLLYASRSLGMSRLPILAEGVNDPELVTNSKWLDRLEPAVGIEQLAGLQGKKRLHNLLLLGAYYAFQPLRLFRKDSAEFFIRAAISESKKQGEEKLGRVALCLLGKTYLEVNEVKTADSVFNLLIQDCRKAGDRETEARAYTYWALYPQPNPQTFPAQIERFQQAADLYQKLGNKEGEINALTDAGYLLAAIMQLPKALDVLVKAFKLAEALRYPYTHYLTDALAMVTTFEGKFGEPFKYSLQTIKAAEAAKDSIGWAYFYARLGDMYRLEGDRNLESSKWYMKALDRFILNKDPGLYLCLYNHTNAMGQLGQSHQVLELVSRTAQEVPPVNVRDQLFSKLAFARGYQGRKQYKKAEELVLEAVKLNEQFPSIRTAQFRSTCNMEMGINLFWSGERERSKKYIEAYLADPFRMRMLRNDISAYERLVIIDSTAGDYPSAMKHWRSLKNLSDSNYNISQRRQAEELQVLYETEEKEAQITVLNQKAKLEEANLKQATLMRNVTIGGIVVALLVAVLLFRQSRQRQRTNEVITHKNGQLEHLLTEKEWLLKEIHHRVKNNLQIVMSLLNSQSAFIDNPYALTAIHDSQHRVHAMSLIHQKLYSGENVSSIEMSVYIREMVSYLSDSFDTGQRIRFDLSIDTIKLDVSQAVPLGLILNEAITNSIKYAFPDSRSGTIGVSLSSTTPGQHVLTIADDGIGVPPDLHTKKAGSLGMSLMQGLSEDLNGSFLIENANGTRITIVFAQEQIIQRYPASSNSSKLHAVQNN